MLVSEILEQSEDFPTIVTDATVRKAAEVMHESNVRALPVVESGRLVGIVTDWDIVVSLAAKAADLADAPVSAIMTKDGLVTIEQSATAAEAAARLAEHRLHHLPVLNGDSYAGMICLGLEWTEQNMLTPPVRPTLTARHP